MLRIHFTSQDLARTRLASAPDPLWEALLSMHLLPGHQAPGHYGGWRATVRRGLTPRPSALLALAPPVGASPDFLTPATQLAFTGLDVRTAIRVGVETVLATPKTQLRADIERTAQNRALPTWVNRLAAGEPAVLDEVGASLTDYCEIAIVPWWGAITARLDTARDRHARLLAHGGVEAFLARLSPCVRWTPPVLHVRYPVHRDVHLDGRGLVLIPSVFCRAPITTCDPRLDPVLVLPIAETTREHRLDDAGKPRGRDRSSSLASVFGRTRAAVLAAMVGHPSTGEVAARTGVSPAAASQHIGVLRDAGLVRTRRMGCSVQHSLTPLGESLLTGVCHTGSPVPRPRGER